MKISLTKEEVEGVLIAHFCREFEVESVGVKLTKFGEHVAEVTFDPKMKWLPAPPVEGPQPGEDVTE